MKLLFFVIFISLFFFFFFFVFVFVSDNVLYHFFIVIGTH